LIVTAEVDTLGAGVPPLGTAHVIPPAAAADITTVIQSSAVMPSLFKAKYIDTAAPSAAIIAFACALTHAHILPSLGVK
jgi:hypothetical protein